MSGFCRYGNRFTAFECFYFAFFNLDCATFERIGYFLCFIGLGKSISYLRFFSLEQRDVFYRQGAVFIILLDVIARDKSKRERKHKHYRENNR